MGRFCTAPNSAGEYLRSILGNNLFIIGSSIAPEPTILQANSIDKALLKVDRSKYILDLRTAARLPEVAKWLSISRPMQANKVSFFLLPVSTAFDALLFLDRDDGR